ncbi:MAG: segregation/condensation protein A [Monoglobales bacterium]
MDVTFKIKEFEGPLDLLLHLIQKNKVEITDIPISEITEQYMEYIDEMKRFDIEVTGDFLVMAATLLYIKSRLLLPKQKDEEEGEDPRTELVDRLIEYAKYKEAVEFLYPRQESGKYYFDKLPEKIKLPKVRYVDMQLEVSLLFEAFANVMENHELKKPVKKEAFDVIVQREIVTVSDRIKYITTVFKNKKDIRFEDFFEDVTTRAQAVSTFLAILELLSHGNLMLERVENGLLFSLSGEKDEFDWTGGDY